MRKNLYYDNDLRGAVFQLNIGVFFIVVNNNINLSVKDLQINKDICTVIYGRKCNSSVQLRNNEEKISAEQYFEENKNRATDKTVLYLEDSDEKLEYVFGKIINFGLATLLQHSVRYVGKVSEEDLKFILKKDEEALSVNEINVMKG